MIYFYSVVGVVKVNNKEPFTLKKIKFRLSRFCIYQFDEISVK